jgi:hypothetical protein
MSRQQHLRSFTESCKSFAAIGRVAPGRFFCRDIPTVLSQLSFVFLFQTKREMLLPHSNGSPCAQYPMVRDGADNRKDFVICRKQHQLHIRLRSKSADVR